MPGGLRHQHQLRARPAQKLLARIGSGAEEICQEYEIGFARLAAARSMTAGKKFDLRRALGRCLTTLSEKNPRMVERIFVGGFAIEHCGFEIAGDAIERGEASS